MSCDCGKRMLIRSSVVLKAVVAEYHGICDRLGCVDLDLTQREVLLFQGNVNCLVFQPFLFCLPVELFFFYCSQLVQG